MLLKRNQKSPFSKFLYSFLESKKLANYFESLAPLIEEPLSRLAKLLEKLLSSIFMCFLYKNQKSKITNCSMLGICLFFFHTFHGHETCSQNWVEVDQGCSKFKIGQATLEQCLTFLVTLIWSNIWEYLWVPSLG